MVINEETFNCVLVKWNRRRPRYWAGVDRMVSRCFSLLPRAPRALEPRLWSVRVLSLDDVDSAYELVIEENYWYEHRRLQREITFSAGAMLAAFKRTGGSDTERCELRCDGWAVSGEEAVHLSIRGMAAERLVRRVSGDHRVLPFYHTTFGTPERAS